MSKRTRIDGAHAQLAWLAGAMVLGMTPWFSATVAGPAMVSEWKADPATSSWLTIAVQLGFVLGTLISAVLLLSDRFSARRLAAGSAIIAALTTCLIAWHQTGPLGAILLRALTGVALAGVYPPGIKIAAGWWQAKRGTAIGVLVGALTIGSAAPNLFRIGSAFTDWRSIIIASAFAAMVSASLFVAVIREGPFQAPSAPFDPRALANVIRDRGVMLATAGYLGHMWELYAMWSSIGVFWAYVVSQRSGSPDVAAVLSFVTIASGALGCVVAGIVADRIGRPIVTIVAMAVSATCAITIGLISAAPLAVLVLVAIVWGTSIVADSAQFSAAVTELAPIQYVGTAITLQTCAGFLLTIVTIRLIPVWARWWSWDLAYAPLAIGPIAGIVAMWQLQRQRRSSRPLA
jgi:MFS family permease